MGFESIRRGPMTITERLRRRAEKCAEDGFDRDSALYLQAVEAIDALCVERDAARLEVCLLRASAGVVSASTDAEMEGYAKSRGWDFTDASTETRTDGAKRAETDTDDGA